MRSYQNEKNTANTVSLTDDAWLDGRYVNSSVINSLLGYIDSRVGLDHSEIKSFGLSRSQLSDSLYRFPGKLYLDLYEVGAQLTQDPLFGFHYGQLANSHRWGVIGYILEVSDTLQEVVQCQSRFQSLVGNIGCTVMHVDGDVSTMEWYTDGKPGQHAAEEALAGWVRFARNLTSEHAKPLKVMFRHAAPENIAEYEAFFNCPVYFEQTMNAIEIPSILFALRLKESNPTIFENLNLRADKMLKQSGRDNLQQQIKAHLIRELPKSVPHIDAVALKFDLSVRSLQRKFEAWGTHYKQFVDATRKDLALAYFDKGKRNLLELTFMLGFSEQSAFQRAFKRWTGTTPKTYLRHQ